MKVIQPPSNPVFQSENVVRERKKFQLETSAKTFKLISSTIYKYKIRAIIREISCNAIDGHVVNGNMRPFDVHIPTQLDPHFTVRDYGVGMSQEMVEDVFSVYFKSTKNDTNSQIGSMGLGSKSPLCYVEAFTVISVHEGTKSAYSVYLEAGEPYCQMLYSTPSDEHSGVTVTIPVLPEDIKEWEEEAHRVYEPFSGIRPNFIGVTKLDINYVKNSEETEYHVHRSEYIEAGIYARMGNILYPLDGSMYKNSLFWSYSVSRVAYIFDFDIGTLDFMPSREELSLDKATKQIITDRMKSINGVFSARLTKALNKCKTVRDKLRFYVDLPIGVQVYVNRMPEMKFDDLTMSELLTRMNLAENYKDISLNGYWGNAWSSSACEFTNTLRNRGYRGSSGKSETMRRQDLVNRLIDPKNAGKLRLINMDISVPRQVLCGYSSLRNDNSYSPFILYSDKSSEYTKEHVKRLISYGMFEESEIEYFTASEMVEEIEAYKSAYNKREATFRSGRSRTSTPTAYEYRLDESGEIEKTPLNLNKTRFLEYGEVPVIRLYGVDDYRGIEETASLDMSRMVKDYMRSIMTMCDIPVILVVRSSLWGYLDKSKHYDVEEIICDWYNEAGKRVKQENHRDHRYCNNQSYLQIMLDEMNIDVSRFVKYTPSQDKEFMDGITFNLIRSGGHAVNRSVNKTYHQHKKRKAESVRRYDEMYDKMIKLNPLLGSIIRVMNDTYKSSSSYQRLAAEDSLNQLKQSLKWK